jgi:hypothetical protein
MIGTSHAVKMLLVTAAAMFAFLYSLTALAQKKTITCVPWPNTSHECSELLIDKDSAWHNCLDNGIAEFDDGLSGAEAIARPVAHGCHDLFEDYKQMQILLVAPNKREEVTRELEPPFEENEAATFVLIHRRDQRGLKKLRQEERNSMKPPVH